MGKKVKQLESEGILFLERAHCCLHGDKQQPYIDFDPNTLYCQVASRESIRMLIACAAIKRNTIIEGADIDRA